MWAAALAVALACAAPALAQADRSVEAAVATAPAKARPKVGLVLSGASPFTLPAIELLRNRGADNGFGAGVYGAPRIVFDGPDRITGRSPAPASDPGGASEAL